MGNTAKTLGPCIPKNVDDQMSWLEEHPDSKTWLSNLQPAELAAMMEVVRNKTVATVEPVDERLERYIAALTMTPDHLKAMTDAFVDELQVGLKIHQSEASGEKVTHNCSLKMLDACIPVFPNGKEKGVFYALDFGGTNFRVVRVSLNGNATMSVTQRQSSLMSGGNLPDCPKGLMDTRATALQLFDFFAQCVYDFMRDEGDIQPSQTEDGKDAPKRPFRAGFTFSFPCQQKTVSDAVLVNWTKGFETGRATEDPVEGLNVAELMNVALNRKGVPMMCNSVLNDTVGTLLSCAYSIQKDSHPPCRVGMILGTGMNCCYIDDEAPEHGYLGKLINIECGNFNRALHRTNIDCELDFHAVANRGFQQAEKMCSGAYLGEIFTTAVVKVYQSRAPALAWEVSLFTTEHLARICNDNTEDLSVSHALLLDIWRSDIPLSELKQFQRIANAVMDRSAAIAAVFIAGCARKCGRLQQAFGGLSVGIDGSLYKCNPWYRCRVRFHLDSILGAGLSNLIELLQADDGSGQGAAILAATV